MGTQPIFGSRIAEYYERAGRVKTLGTTAREGRDYRHRLLSPGGDISEPRNAKYLRIVKVFWGLDANWPNVAISPAINWLSSYSLHKMKSVAISIQEQISWSEKVTRAMNSLQKRVNLQEIVRLVGPDSLSEKHQFETGQDASVHSPAANF